APGAPRNLVASVSGHDVSLTWRNVGDATAFVVDVGLAPGRTDVSVYHDGGTAATFTGVPSGTYFVRVRGGNTFGGGRPSNEAVVVVP
ncbi:MAG: fibronectin type III domain-containing protein, partial [Acidobacteria bacterium]|nr:fibronectin type III domain-containing protein [Acidobacteriota bacterium]